jgi:hypothetical protein
MANGKKAANGERRVANGKTAASSEWRLANGETAIFWRAVLFALPKNFGIEHRTLNSALRTDFKVRPPKRQNEFGA